MQGLFVLSLKATQLSSVSTAYYYISIYDRYMNSIKERNLTREQAKAVNFGALFMAYKMDEVELHSQYLADLDQAAGKKTFYQMVL